MVLGGADHDEIIKAAITISVIAGLLGRPYGLYLDWKRMQFAFKQVFNTDNERIN